MVFLPRERPADIPELARHFLIRACQKENCRIKEIAPGALQALRLHPWPGNVRELQNAIERAMLLCPGDEINLTHLPPAVVHGGVPSVDSESGPVRFTEEVERLESALIVKALECNDWNKSRAASFLGITPRMISYKMQNLGIARPS